MYINSRRSLPYPVYVGLGGGSGRAFSAGRKGGLEIQPEPTVKIIRLYLFSGPSKGKKKVSCSTLEFHLSQSSSKMMFIKEEPEVRLPPCVGAGSTGVTFSPPTPASIIFRKVKQE